MKSENNSLGKGIGTLGIWLGIGAMSFSGAIDDTLPLIAVFALVGTAAIWAS